MYYWIVSKTPSNGVYEHGFTQRVLLNSRYEVEGITVKHYESSEVSEIPDWAKINIGNKIIEGYDQFLENITEIEFKTRDTLRRRFKNRYLVLDSNVPEKLLVLIDGNQNFKKVYQNKLYKVYLMQVADKK
jgi:hypothetical protein